MMDELNNSRETNQPYDHSVVLSSIAKLKQVSDILLGRLGAEAYLHHERNNDISDKKLLFSQDFKETQQKNKCRICSAPSEHKYDNGKSQYIST